MRFLSKKQVCHMIGISRATLDRWKLDPAFPKRATLGKVRVGFPEHEILAWMEDRLKTR